MLLKCGAKARSMCVLLTGGCLIWRMRASSDACGITSGKELVCVTNGSCLFIACKWYPIVSCFIYFIERLFRRTRTKRDQVQVTRSCMVKKYAKEKSATIYIGVFSNFEDRIWKEMFRWLFKSIEQLPGPYRKIGQAQESRPGYRPLASDRPVTRLLQESRPGLRKVGQATGQWIFKKPGF